MTELEALTARVARADQLAASLAHDLEVFLTFGQTYDPTPAEDMEGTEPEPEDEPEVDGYSDLYDLMSEHGDLYYEPDYDYQPRWF